mgnify:CR=1 FL=1
MELIHIDSVIITCVETYRHGQVGEQLLLDTDTGVVYFSGKQPRYDANGRVMVIPRDQLPGVIARARAQISAKAAEEERKHTFTQV